MNARHDNTRQHILETGQRIIVGKGFASVGLNEILNAAGVPKGSFYHYFPSKEQYGEALLQDYFQRYLADLDILFADGTADGRALLLRYFRRWHGQQLDDCAEQKCLVVKLGGEVSDLSDAMRIALRDGTARIVRRLAEVVALGVADGSVARCEALSTAQTLYQLWLGASLLGKLDRTAEALDRALAFTAELLTPR